MQARHSFDACMIFSRATGFFFRKHYLCGNYFDKRDYEFVISQDSIGNLYKQQGNQLYRLVLQPIARFLTKKDTIYYSLSGLLNRISLPAIQTESNNLLDRCDMRLISCSHEIIYQKIEIMFTELQKYLDVFYILGLSPEKIDTRKQMLPNSRRSNAYDVALGSR